MTIYGQLEALAVFIFLGGLFLKSWRRFLLVIGASIFLTTVGFHIYKTKDTGPGYRIFTLPESNKRTTFWLKFFDEQDILYLGTQLYPLLTRTKAFSGEFSEPYQTLEISASWPLASPVLGSLREKASENRNWTTEFSPKLRSASHPAIFLHGAMGSYTIQCWLVASIIRLFNYTTICPSLSFSAPWSGETGKAVLARTITYAQSQFPGKRILFFGLSNGAVGLSQQRDWLAGVASGFVYISGGKPMRHNDSTPTLMLWGEHDQSMPFELGKQIKHLNPKFTFEFVKEDHSAFVRSHRHFQKVLEDWLQQVGLKLLAPWPKEQN